MISMKVSINRNIFVVKDHLILQNKLNKSIRSPEVDHTPRNSFLSGITTVCVPEVRAAYA